MWCAYLYSNPSRCWGIDLLFGLMEFMYDSFNIYPTERRGKVKVNRTCCLVCVFQRMLCCSTFWDLQNHRLTLPIYESQLFTHLLLRGRRLSQDTLKHYFFSKTFILYRVPTESKKNSLHGPCQVHGWNTLTLQKNTILIFARYVFIYLVNSYQSRKWECVLFGFIQTKTNWNRRTEKISVENSVLTE